jgi:hypothetical protein
MLRFSKSRQCYPTTAMTMMSSENDSKVRIGMIPEELRAYIYEFKDVSTMIKGTYADIIPFIRCNLIGGILQDYGARYISRLHIQTSISSLFNDNNRIKKIGFPLSKKYDSTNLSFHSRKKKLIFL